MSFHILLFNIIILLYFIYSKYELYTLNNLNYTLTNFGGATLKRYYF
jgi:hypothetical protein